jgi:hypothetical protein
MANNDQQKTYIVFLDDESGSMDDLKAAAIKDHNATIASVKDAATKYQQDTIVSNFGFGRGEVRRYVVNSNPHVLVPKTSWLAAGGTPGRKALKEAIDLLKTMPDYNSPNVAFAVFTTTDGEFDSDYYGASGPRTADLAREITELTATGRWTFVFRVPKNGIRHLDGLRIPAGNIQEWETTAAGMEKSTVATTQAMDQFFATRSTGQKSSTVFYANATNVDTSKLLDISGKTSLYLVEAWENGDQIRDFILRRRTRYLKGSAFYQLTKTEPRVGPKKIIAVRPRSGPDFGKVFAGLEARTMLGLSSVDNIRLHPGDHGDFDIFIQSESINRKLVAGTGVLYWEAIGVPFTQEEIDRFTGKAPVAPAKPAVVQLPAVAPTNKPTANPLHAAKKAAPAVSLATHGVPVTRAPAHGIVKPQPLPAVKGRVRYHSPTAASLFYSTRDIAREVAHSMPGKKQYDAGPGTAYGRRFFVDAA